MTLNGFIEIPKKQVSLKSALKRMRQIWDKGPVNRFDAKLSRILDVSLEQAEQIRESWVSLGFLGYTKNGLLKWRSGGF